MQCAKRADPQVAETSASFDARSRLSNKWVRRRAPPRASRPANKQLRHLATHDAPQPACRTEF